MEIIISPADHRLYFDFTGHVSLLRIFLQRPCEQYFSRAWACCAALLQGYWYENERPES